MRKQDIISILITFAFGAASGAYLFTMVYAPFIADKNTPDSEKLSELIIEGQIYGGCRSACPSFQILGDGSFKYLSTPENGQEQVLREGTVPSEYQRNLRKVLTKTALQEQSQVTESASCNSFTDGIDVAYDITIKGTEYELDSCGTAIDGTSKLWLSLHELWAYFKTTGNN